MEILPICRDLEILYDDVYWSYDMYILEMYDLYPCDCWEILYMHVVWILMCRRSVYFLNIYIIRVYYRFNRNRALHDRRGYPRMAWYLLVFISYAFGVLVAVLWLGVGDLFYFINWIMFDDLRVLMMMYMRFWDRDFTLLFPLLLFMFMMVLLMVSQVFT